MLQKRLTGNNGKLKENMPSPFIVYQYKSTFNEVDEAQNRKTSQLEESLSVIQIIIKEIKNNNNNAAQDT